MKDVNWLKDCELCNVGVCNRIDDYTKHGMSVVAAAKQMEKDCGGLWDAEKIRGRYRYYKLGHNGGKVGGNPQHPLSVLLQQINEERKAIKKALDSMEAEGTEKEVAHHIAILESNVGIAKLMLKKECDPGLWAKLSERYDMEVAA